MTGIDPALGVLFFFFLPIFASPPLANHGWLSIDLFVLLPFSSSFCTGPFCHAACSLRSLSLLTPNLRLQAKVECLEPPPFSTLLKPAGRPCAALRAALSLGASGKALRGQRKWVKWVKCKEFVHVKHTRIDI